MTNANADLARTLLSASNKSSGLREELGVLNSSCTKLTEQLNETQTRHDTLADLMRRGRPPTPEEVKELEASVERMEASRREQERELADSNEVLLYLNDSAAAQSNTFRRVIDGLRPKVAAVEVELHQAVTYDQQAQEQNEKLAAAVQREGVALRRAVAKLQTAKRNALDAAAAEQEARAAESERTTARTEGAEALVLLRRELTELQGKVRGRPHAGHRGAPACLTRQTRPRARRRCSRARRHCPRA